MVYLPFCFIGANRCVSILIFSDLSLLFSINFSFLQGDQIATASRKLWGSGADGTLRSRRESSLAPDENIVSQDIDGLRILIVQIAKSSHVRVTTSYSPCAFRKVDAIERHSIFAVAFSISSATAPPPALLHPAQQLSMFLTALFRCRFTEDLFFDC